MARATVATLARPVYVTLDADGRDIERDADILRFRSMSAALRYVRAHFPPAEVESVELTSGSFGDAWQKWHRRPVPVRDSHRLAPFRFADVRIAEPGQHPGGREWWITAPADVLVPVVVWKD